MNSWTWRIEIGARAVSNLRRQQPTLVWDRGAAVSGSGSADDGGEDAATLAPDTGGVSVRGRVRERAGESQMSIKGPAFPSGRQFSSTSSTQEKMKCIVSISSRKLRTSL